MAAESTQCNERVGRGVVTYPCTLRGGHDGPHVADEIRSSVSERQRWELAQRHAAGPLAQFQGFPQTTAERYTDNPTPVPQSESILRQDAAETQAQRSAKGATEAMEDGLEVLYRDAHIVLKELPDGAYMVEHPSGSVGQRVQPTWIDLADGDGEPTKQREGDQRLPEANGMRDSQSIMAEDILERREIGIRRYGTPLQPFNDRDTIQDAYEEALDLAAYLRTLVTMRAAMRDDLVEQAMDALDGVLPHPVGQSEADYRRDVAVRVVDRLLDALTSRREG